MQAQALRLHRTSESLRIENDLFFCELHRESAGFPAALGFTDSGQVLLQAGQPLAQASLRGTGNIRPVLKQFRPVVRREPDSVRVLFDNVAWENADGKILPDYRLSLDYEIHSDGAAFARTFFYTDTVRPGRIDHFSLQPELRLASGQNVNWSYWQLQDSVSVRVIDNLGHIERRLGRRDSRNFPGTIVPFVSFDFGDGPKRDRHAEFFVESVNSVGPDDHKVASSVSWQGRAARVTWEFAKPSRAAPRRPYHWDNVWGWCLRRFPVTRKPPLRIFHYFDNFERYPASGVVRAVAEQGANVLIIHENWKHDFRNQEVPHDARRLKRTIALCHRHGLRVCLYVRGNEDGIRHAFGAQLGAFLEHDLDGLYMDYGTPIGYALGTENAPRGRICFHEYYLMTKRVRRFVGDNGLHISHSGACFSALGHTFVDAYLGGEQEKGALIRNRSTHAYFSGLSVAPSSLWTAAFPVYRTRRMLPYLATTLQAPFVHLGTQIPDSALAHARIPSAVNHVRALWRLWELLDGAPTIKAYLDQTTEGVFATDSPSTGVSAMVTPKGDVLVVAANFSARRRNIRIEADLATLGVKGKPTAFELTVDDDAARYRQVNCPQVLAAPCKEYGLKGWLFVQKPATWRKRLARFCRPFAHDAKGEAGHRQRIEAIRHRRFHPPRWSQCYLRVEVSDWPNNYEDSIWFDLFDNEIELNVVAARGKTRRLGYATTRGLRAHPPDRSAKLWPGKKTPWIALHAVCPRPDAHLVLATRRGKGEFYSLIRGRLSPVPRDCKEAYDIEYHNDIDLDWSRLEFRVNLRGDHP